MLIIGSHVNFNKKQLLGCVEQALSYGANTFMFYTGSNISTMRSKLETNLTNQAHKLMKNNHIDINNIVVHAPYLINLANPEKNDFGKTFLKGEITRCQELGINKLILHPGAAGSQSLSTALQNIIDCLNEIFTTEKSVCILLETMAGKGSECGSSLDEIKTIIEGIIHKECIGVCIDTCHLNDAGYDLNKFDKYLNEFDEKIGLSYLKCIHINDSKNLIGSHKDRHENFGYGTIGFSNLINIIYYDKLKDIPKILETPYITADNSKEKEYPPYKLEIAMIQAQTFNPHLIDDIRNHYK